MPIEPDDVEPDLEWGFGHDPHAAADARTRVADVVDGHVVDDVQLAASELVTNAVTHTDDGGELRVWVSPDHRVRLEVEDTDGGVPAIPAIVPQQGGRGLRIVEAIAAHWGVRPTPDGKVVWAEFEGDDLRSDEEP